MRIAIFHELDFGGAKRVVVEYAKRLKKDNIVDVYYVDDNKDTNLENYCTNSYWYKFNPKVWKENNWKTRLYKDTIDLFRLYRLHKKIARDIKRKNYDYIFVHPSKFTQAPFLLRFIKNCIYYCQEPLRIVYDSAVSSNISNISFPKNLYEFFNRKVRKWIDFRNISNASIILANSNYSKKFIEQSYNIKAEVCYLGVDINLFKPLNLSKIIDVLFIGNKDDGYMLLNKLSQFFDNNIKIKVVFRENGASLTDDELVKIYNQSKVMIALNHNEPFGLIPLETMACGTPVIAVDEGGYRESVINRKTGFLISRNSNELYDKIEIVINNEKIRKEMAKNARENILQNWTWDKSIAKFLKIIKYAK